MALTLPTVTATLVTDPTKVRGEFGDVATRRHESAVLVDLGTGDQFAMTKTDFEAFAPLAVYDSATKTYND